MIESELVIITFIVTALWDVVLRLMSENYSTLPKFLQMDFIRYLIPYFNHHTILSAALIAGIVGAVTQYIIIKVHPFPNNIENVNNVIKFLLISFIISGLFGFPMKFSKLFPHLERTYYKNLGQVNGIIHDGISGIIVQLTLLALFYSGKLKIESNNA